MPRSAPDLTGQTFGYWTVISPDPSRHGNGYMLCRCRCGTERIIQASMLRRGKTQSCACRKQEPIMDLTDKTFGRWKILSQASTIKPGIYWICQCSCGIIRRVRGTALRHGASKNCGCERRIRLHKRTYKHGEAKHRKRSQEYGIWANMKQRCLNPDFDSYRYYGGRGIAIAPEWIESFSQFLHDMGRRPPRATLERIDNNGPYSLANCRWATRAEQSRNTRRNIWLTYEGRTQCLQDWSVEIGMAYTTLFGRIQRRWSVHDTLKKPLQNSRKHKYPSQ